ncbi:MarR family winged helix-turn-helix transcriptional regulator [Reyranella sp. CPCC 100927]|uniref:MarR family winged helix-turn-helix transcriptional regulator n=1 Tax=Reyranella sp. CPCC 100927 TaxID=2599616 RepID=UPI0011B5432F|nr:MarR family transcriptional regulator [Reyranella sp. CPCC 100927]TWT05159.1 MarR family transcriptional regulator [Reyranella sp. CPCC 100927]
MRHDDLFAKPGHLIRRCQQIAVSIFMDECRALDLTPIQYAVLSALRAQPDIDQATLAALVALDRSTLGEVVMRLQHRRLIDRRPSERDRRSKVLRTTATALRLLDRAEATVRRSQERILAPLTPAERRTFMRLLSKLVDINNALSRAPMAVSAAKAGGRRRSSST